MGNSSRRRVYARERGGGGGGGIRVLLYEPYRNLPPQLSVDGGGSFLRIDGLGFDIIKAVVSKTGVIACLGKVNNGDLGVYVSRDDGASFVRLDITLSPIDDLTSIAITSDGEGVYVLTGSGLYVIRGGVLHQLLGGGEIQGVRSSLYVSGTGNAIFTFFEIDPNTSYATYTYDGGQSFKLLSLHHNISLNRDCNLMAMYWIYDLTKLYARNVSADDDSYITKLFGNTPNANKAGMVGNNGSVYYSFDGAIKGLDFASGAIRDIIGNAVLLDINTLGDLGVIIKRNYGELPTLINMITGATVKRFIGNQLHLYRHCAIGK